MHAIRWGLGLLISSGCGIGVGGTQSFESDSSSLGDDGSTSGGTGGDATGSEETSGDATSGSDDDDDGDPPPDGGSSSSGSGSVEAAAAVDDFIVLPQNTVPAELDVLGNDSGTDLTVDSADAMTTLGATILVDGDGVLTYSAQPWLLGEDSFEYIARDADGGVSTATVHVLVRPTNVALLHVGAGNGGFAFTAEDVGDRAGSSVAGGGDVDGDGAPDLVVGAFAADPNGGASGRTYVLSAPTGQGTETLADSGFAIDGEAVADLSGESSSIAGDVNGDDVVDVIVGARGSDFRGTDSGRAYVVWGGAGIAGVQLADVAAGIGGFAIDAEAAGDLCGLDVASAGDVNGDGLADVIVGAPDAVDNGRAYIVFGKADGGRVDLVDIAAGLGGFALVGEDDGDRAGFSVAPAGDMNADGFDDVVVGGLRADPNGASSGRVYVVFGTDATTPIALADVTAGIGGFAIDGAGSNDRAGFSVAGGADINGDAVPDVIVGAPGGPAAYAVFGKGDTGTVDLGALGDGGFEMTGTAGSDAGEAVALAGDVNGDGLNDVLVGAPSSDAASPDAGRAFLVYGKANSETVDLPALADGDGAIGFTLDGANQDHRAGGAVGPAGHIDGDGYADLVIGATGTAEGGAAYIFHGVPSEFL